MIVMGRTTHRVIVLPTCGIAENYDIKIEEMYCLLPRQILQRQMPKRA